MTSSYCRDVIQRTDVDEAGDRIRDHVRTTPLCPVDSDLIGGRAVFKLEYLQHTGSFKARGAFNRILRARENGSLDPATGIVVASGGNAGMANAYAAARLGVRATVFVPETAPAVKVARLASYDARVVLAGREYATAYEAAQEEVSRTGALYCHAYDQPEIAAGAGTLALELLEQVPAGLDTVVVAVGGGGLLAGVTTALDGAATVVGVEPAGAPTLRSALDAGRPVDVPVSGVAADSLGARRLGEIAFDVASRLPVTSVVVTDDDIIAARSMLWDRWRIVVEHGAAAALAGVTSGAYRPEPDERVAVVLCGANTDPSDL
ncbi:threonine/serine dehydratase [Terrabacter sp. MAHUQ-38]|nr:threonine/serine dehydratase [Terrabacter sp. MAHUQ-38]MBC9823447.1 threonine/serine dehydratase [Terrabacter sp. MAHUQ-38]